MLPFACMDSGLAHLIETLRLEPHPEGGFYREFFRSPLAVTPADGRGERSALTAIYFLLASESRSRWHAIRSDEQWAYVEGDPVELLVLDPATGRLASHKLGPAHDGYEGVAIAPAGSWQATRPFHGWGLLICTTGPGFDFADFRFLAEDTNAAQRIRSEWPHLAELL